MSEVIKINKYALITLQQNVIFVPKLAQYASRIRSRTHSQLLSTKVTTKITVTANATATVTVTWTATGTSSAIHKLDNVLS